MEHDYLNSASTILVSTCLAIQRRIRIIPLLDCKELTVILTEGGSLPACLVWVYETLEEDFASLFGCCESLRAARCRSMIGGHEIYRDPAWQDQHHAPRGEHIRPTQRVVSAAMSKPAGRAVSLVQNVPEGHYPLYLK